MINSLSGVIDYLGPNYLTIDVQGVGYRVDSARPLGAVGDKIKVFIHTHVREDILALYGFSTREELVLFELLLTVSGIGPKLAMAVMARGLVEQILKAIAIGDPTFFEGISGLGKKNSAKIIIELKSKLGPDADLSGILQSFSAPDSEALNALLSLGYSKKEAVEALRQLEPGLSEEEKVRGALKMMGRKI